MDHLSVLDRMRHPDTDFLKLFPQNNNGIFWVTASEATLPWNSSGWYMTKPQFLTLVEPHPSITDAFVLHTMDGSCTLTAQALDNFFNGYPAVYKAALLVTDNTALATEVATVAWLQQYRLDDTVIVPDADGLSWNIHDKVEYSVHGDSSSCIYVKHETLLALYPHASNIFEHVQSLGLTSLDVEELLQATTILERLDSSPNKTCNEIILPGNISA